MNGLFAKLSVLGLRPGRNLRRRLQQLYCFKADRPMARDWRQRVAHLAPIRPTSKTTATVCCV